MTCAEGSLDCYRLHLRMIVQVQISEYNVDTLTSKRCNQDYIPCFRIQDPNMDCLNNWKLLIRKWNQILSLSPASSWSDIFYFIESSLILYIITRWIAFFYLKSSPHISYTCICSPQRTRPVFYLCNFGHKFWHGADLIPTWRIGMWRLNFQSGRVFGEPNCPKSWRALNLGCKIENFWNRSQTLNPKSNMMSQGTWSSSCGPTVFNLG